jgi:hypothetical protein
MQYGHAMMLVTRLLPVCALLALVGCVSSVAQLQTARTLPAGKKRFQFGASVPVSTRYVQEIIDSIKLAADRLQDAENADRPVTEAEQRQAIETAAAVLLLQPAVVPELSARIGVFDNFDMSLRWAGPTFRLDGKYQLVDQPGEWHAALHGAYVHHTGVGASIATGLYEIFDKLRLASYSRKDIELGLLVSTEEEKRPVSMYGGLRYFLAMPRIESALVDGLEAESGRPLIETETNIHQFGATFGVRVGNRRVSLMAELTVLWMIFETEILDQKTDLGGLVFAPGVGVAVDI